MPQAIKRGYYVGVGNAEQGRRWIGNAGRMNVGRGLSDRGEDNFVFVFSCVIFFNETVKIVNGGLE